MILVERHIINNNHDFYGECDELSFLSKNLYNLGLYTIRQHFFETKEYLTYVSNFHKLKKSEDYKKLPAKVSNQTLKMVDKNFKSFFSLLRKKLPSRIPKYLDSRNGRFIVIYEKQSLSLRSFKKTGEIKLSKTNIIIKTKIKDWSLIKEVRVVPRSNHYVIEVVYEKLEKTIMGSGVASIDPGLNNLVTITFNENINPFIISGGPLKSINQFYNKEKSRLQSELELKQKKKKSKRIIKLTEKRNNKILDYLHKSSHLLVNQLVSNQIKTLVIGKNIGQKQNINLGKTTNQNFINLPLFKFLNIVSYKSKLEGIEVIFQEESYTSKCSFIDLEPIKKHEIYIGKRVKRGLFRTKNGNLINSDVNGSYNIMRKAIPNVFSDGIEGVAVNPVKLYV